MMKDLQSMVLNVVFRHKVLKKESGWAVSSHCDMEQNVSLSFTAVLNNR